MNVDTAKRNYIYNLLFQIFALITPLVTTPYVSRVLSPVGVGEYSFVASINSYFCLVAALGFSTYGQREIAKNQSSKREQSIVLWELCICKFVLGIIVLLVCWTAICLGIFGEYSLLMKIMSIEIVSTSLNIAFFYQGNERFGLIAARDFIIRLLGIILTFCFVKNQNDLWKYALCNVMTSLVSTISLWIPLRNDIIFVSLKNVDIARHFVPCVKLFVPTIAISIYTILDKTLIGILVPGTIETKLDNGEILVKRLADVENGFYAQSEKIIKMAMTVIASLGTVMMPRNSKELAEGHEKNFLRNVNRAIEFVFFIGAPLWAGITAVAANFSPWFFGEGYDRVPVLMCIFAAMIIPAGLGNVLGQQYLIPKGEDFKYAVVYVISAIVNFTLNVLLIPRMLSYGAAIASVIAETMAPLVMLFLIKDDFDFTSMLKNNVKPIVSAMGMCICVWGTSRFLPASFMGTACLVLEGIVVYLLFTICLKCSFTYDILVELNRRRRCR